MFHLDVTMTIQVIIIVYCIGCNGHMDVVEEMRRQDGGRGARQSATEDGGAIGMALR
jgi:hypothetical protein